MLESYLATHVQSTEEMKDGKEVQEVVCLREQGRKSKTSIGRERETKMRKKKNTQKMRSVDGKRRGRGRKTKSEAMKGAVAKNVKSVHKYRGP